MSIHFRVAPPTASQFARRSYPEPLTSEFTASPSTRPLQATTPGALGAPDSSTTSAPKPAMERSRSGNLVTWAPSRFTSQASATRLPVDPVAGNERHAAHPLHILLSGGRLPFTRLVPDDPPEAVTVVAHHPAAAAVGQGDGTDG